MVEALATGCGDYDACWRPVSPPDGFPFVPWYVAGLWLALLVVCVVAFIHRLGRD